MSRLFRNVIEFFAIFAAATEASAAVSQHRMPSSSALKRLGIGEKAMRSVHI